MAHEVETMAYANAVPWHGLGIKVDEFVSIDEMLIAAGLDWEVELRPVYTMKADGDVIKIENKRALVRQSDDKPLTVAGPHWKPLQNRDALEFFREYTESGGATLETAGSLRDGRLIWALAKINKDFFIKGRQNDETKGYILLSSPHEAGYRIKVRTTATRVVCANTFAMAERDAVSYAQSHTTNFNVDKARESIQLAMDQVAQMEKDANLLASKTISEYDVARFYSRLLQPVETNDLTEEDHVTNLLEDPMSRNKKFQNVWASYTEGPGAEVGTMWGVFNGITHWADHKAGASKEVRLHSAWFSGRSRLKQKAYSELLEMAA